MCFLNKKKHCIMMWSSWYKNCNNNECFNFDIRAGLRIIYFRWNGIMKDVWVKNENYLMAFHHPPIFNNGWNIWLKKWEIGYTLIICSLNFCIEYYFFKTAHWAFFFFNIIILFARLRKTKFVSISSLLNSHPYRMLIMMMMKCFWVLNCERFLFASNDIE